MDDRRAHSASVAVSHLHHVRPWDREALTRPGRREATARVRQEWECSRRQAQPRVSEREWLKEYSAYLTRLRKYKENRPEEKRKRESQEKSVFRDVWAKEVFKRNTPERLPYVTRIRAVTAPSRQPLQDNAHTPVPLFQQVSGATRHSMERGRRPMHFIDKEWASERVSWVRFHTNLSDYHTRSWIE